MSSAVASRPTPSASTTPNPSINSPEHHTRSSLRRIAASATEAASQPPHVAVVVFDPLALQFSVITDKETITDLTEGESIEHEGRNVTVIALCKTVAEATSVSRQKADEFSQVIKTDVAVTQLMNGASLELDDDDVDKSRSPSPVDEAVIGKGVTGDGRYRAESVERRVDYDQQAATKEILHTMFNELQQDIVRLNERSETMSRMLTQYFGGDFGEGIPRRAMYQRFGIPRSSYNLFNGGDLFAHKKRRKSRAGPDGGPMMVESDDEDDDFNEADVDPDGGFARSSLTYPFPEMTREEEERCLRKAAGSSSEYGKLLCKTLFADSLHLYFKDQCPKKRQWVHEAVDYRFPCYDKASHAAKWKNCSTAINKNRTVGGGGRGSVDGSDDGDDSKMVSKPPLIKFVPAEYEEETFRTAGKDSAKYTEMLAFKLFEDTLDRMFRDQDTAKKDWLRRAVDSRYPMADKERREVRWKVCAGATNKNRHKTVGNDGEQVRFPYLNEEFEKACYKEAGNNYTLYAEMMGKALFEGSLGIYFKDQDPRKKIFLHDMIDTRYPTHEKGQHVAKWKSCTSAINKLRPDSGPTLPAISYEVRAPSSSVASSAASTPRPAAAPAKAASVKEEVVPVKEEITRRAGKRTLEEPEEASPAPVVRERSTRTSLAAAAAQATPSTSTAGGGGGGAPPAKRKGGVPAMRFIDEATESAIFDKCENNVMVYARNLGKVLFKDSLNLYLKDQEPDRREFLHEIVDYRFPTNSPLKTKQKWKNCSAAINRNRPDQK